MKIICFGDSNTYGYDPRGPFGSRYPEPWPEQLADLTGWDVLNQGENGLEIPKKPVLFPEDTDLLIVMLGTNDLLQFWSPEAACEKMEAFLKAVSLPILLLAPPTMKPGAWVEDQDLIDDRNTLAERYQILAQRLGIPFADPAAWVSSLAYDGIHLTESGHTEFAQGLFQYLSKGELLCWKSAPKHPPLP